ncbi:MAG: hypothetical protein AB7T74_03725 [Clostridia bacterium]
MKQDRHIPATRARSPFTMALGLAAVAVMVLLAPLSVAWVSGHRGGSGTGSGTDVLAAPEATQPDTARQQAIQPLGVRPSHLGNSPVSSVPNQQAITLALWAPGIDHGYVPQGLAFAEGQVLVSGYRSTSPAVSMGACRVYRVDPATGESTGYFDLPPACGHAGGLAYAGDGVLILSDTRRLYRINLEHALREQHARNAITGILDLGGALRGSFSAFVPAQAWPGDMSGNQPDNQTGSEPVPGPGVFIGAWSTSARKARGYFLPLSLFDSHTGSTITENNATHTLALRARAQGGSFAPDGSLWLSYSSHDFGRVEQLDAASGQILASYLLVNGTEDIGFDNKGNLWAVSEAGSLRWRSWRTSFPVVFRLDTTLLE